MERTSAVVVGAVFQTFRQIKFTISSSQVQVRRCKFAFSLVFCGSCGKRQTLCVVCGQLTLENLRLFLRKGILQLAASLIGVYMDMVSAIVV